MRNELSLRPTTEYAPLAFMQATAAVDRAHDIVVVCHISPDADAVGSACAVVAGLKQRGKNVRAIVGQEEPVGSELASIPGAVDIEPSDHLGPCDLVIVVDCGSSSRTGSLEDEILAQSEKVIVIDHHATNNGFGRIDLIDRDAESTTTVIYQWFGFMGIHVDKAIAYCLYAGLSTDTGSFRWGRSHMHGLAQDLVDTGLDIRAMSRQLFDAGTVSDLIMIGKVLQDLRLEYVGSLAVVIAVASSDKLAGHSHGAVERIPDMISGVSDGDVVVVFKEYSPEDWAVSLRSDTEDVSVLATALGGGGHIHSSGYTTVGSQEQVIAQVLNALAAIEDDKEQE